MGAGEFASATRVRCTPPFSAAVSTALVFAATPEAVTVKFAEDTPSGTDTAAGAFNSELLLNRATEAPPDGAG